MKVVMTAIGCLIVGFGSLCHGAEKMNVFVNTVVTNVTSESVPFKVVFTNCSDMSISVLKPVVGRDMVVRVYDKAGEQLARSGVSLSGYGKEVKKEYVSLKPRATWASEMYELFNVVSPSFRMTPDQTVRVEVVYSMDGREYMAAEYIRIPPHDMGIKPEYISKEKALELAVQELKKSGDAVATRKDLELEVQCINGIYRVVFLKEKAVSKAHMWGGGRVLRVIQIDAATGKVIQVALGRR